MTEQAVSAAIQAFEERLSAIERFQKALTDSDGNVNKKAVQEALAKLDKETGFDYQRQLDALTAKINFQKIATIGSIIILYILEKVLENLHWIR